MIGLELDQTTQAFLSLAILLGMFVLFVRETYPVEVTAMGGAASCAGLPVQRVIPTGPRIICTRPISGWRNIARGPA